LVTAVPTGAEQQGVAVGGCLGDDLRADIAARAGLVVDDHLLAPDLGEVLCHDAAQQIGRAGGGERHHHADLLVRIGALGTADHRRREQTAGQHHAPTQHLGHDIPPEVRRLYRPTKGRQT
jgi:hypothetical protein